MNCSSHTGVRPLLVLKGRWVRAAGPVAPRCGAVRECGVPGATREALAPGSVLTPPCGAGRRLRWIRAGGVVAKAGGGGEFENRAASFGGAGM